MKVTNIFVSLSPKDMEKTHSEFSEESKSKFQVIYGSEVESYFLNLNVKNCSVTDVPIQRNNFHWQHQESGIYLYNAYYDNRFHYEGSLYRYVRVLSMTYGRLINVKLFCTLSFYGKENFAHSVEAKYSEIWFNLWNSNTDSLYYAYLISCPIPTNLDEKIIPSNISITIKECGRASNNLKVFNQEFKKSHGSFAICTKGLNFNEDITHRLVEWIEINRLLGAQKFFVYYYNLHENVMKVLKYYETINVLHITPLTLPGLQPNNLTDRHTYFKKNIWQKRRNEVIPYNDCLYRNINSFEFVIPLDIDEVIIPNKEFSWKEMFDNQQNKLRQKLKKFSSISAQNVYFFKKFNVNENQLLSPILSSKIRSANFSTLGHSVKSFISTNCSLYIFNHYTLKPLYPKMLTNFVADESLMQLNHYKDSCPSEIYTKCHNDYLVYKKTDNIIDKYSDILKFNIDSVLKFISSVK